MTRRIRVAKHAISPEARRHKSEYDSEYGSTPERKKYHVELNRERRRRGIYGRGGPDMSHTKEGTLVAEDPHTNRARHFKERGTLKSSSDLAILNIIKGKEDAPNYRKASADEVKSGRRCGTCQHWEKRDGDTGYCQMWDFICRADHICDSWEGSR